MITLLWMFLASLPIAAASTLETGAAPWLLDRAPALMVATAEAPPQATLSPDEVEWRRWRAEKRHRIARGGIIAFAIGVPVSIASGFALLSGAFGDDPGLAVGGAVGLLGGSLLTTGGLLTFTIASELAAIDLGRFNRHRHGAGAVAIVACGITVLLPVFAPVTLPIALIAGSVQFSQNRRALDRLRLGIAPQFTRTSQGLALTLSF